MHEDEQVSSVSLHMGFPNPAADRTLGVLDLNQLLIQHTTSTFCFTLRGQAWESFGIFDNDIAIVDRSLDPRSDDLVIWWDESVDEFAIAKQKAVPDNALVWGVVTSTIHQHRKVNA